MQNSQKLKITFSPYLFLFLLPFLMLSCKKDNELEEVFDLLPEKFYNELIDNGFVFNLGDAPPNVEGIYSLEPVNEYDNSNAFLPGQAAITAKLKFVGQSGNSLDVSIKNWTAVNEVDESEATIIVGDNNAFSIVAQATGDIGEIVYRYNYVLTGIFTTDGIQNAQFGFVMVDNPGALGVATTGTVRIFRDQDFLAAKTDFFRNSQEQEINGKHMLSK